MYTAVSQSAVNGVQVPALGCSGDFLELFLAAMGTAVWRGVLWEQVCVAGRVTRPPRVLFAPALSPGCATSSLVLRLLPPSAGERGFAFLAPHAAVGLALGDACRAERLPEHWALLRARCPALPVPGCACGVGAGLGSGRRWVTPGSCGESGSRR